MECPFVFKFKASGQGLTVFHMNNNHNHEVSQIEFHFAPKKIGDRGQDSTQGDCRHGSFECQQEENTADVL